MENSNPKLHGSSTLIKTEHASRSARYMRYYAIKMHEVVMNETKMREVVLKREKQYYIFSLNAYRKLEMHKEEPFVGYM